MATALKDHSKEPHGKDSDDREGGKNKDENMKFMKRGEEEEKNVPLVNSWMACMENY